MARAFSIGLGVLLCFAGTARADKPRLAVLGLEVAPGPAGAIDPGAVLIAREVTKELRQRVLSPACPYVLAPNSNKELLDEKLLMSCDSEAVDCMVVIGAGLASDALLYGRVEKRGDGFRVSLKLLDTRRKQIQPAVDDLAGGGGVAGAARRLYRRLIGDGPGNDGAVLVRARGDGGSAVRGGSVIVDDDPRGPLVNGKLLVTGVAEGRHTIAISVAGFRRFEEIVAVHGGEQATIEALLHRQPGAPDAMPAPPTGAAAGAAAAPAAAGAAAAPPPATGAAAAPLETPPAAPPPVRVTRPSPLWKLSLVAGAAAVVAGGAYAWYSYDRQQAHAAYAPVDSGHCGDSDDSLRSNAGIDLAAFHRACTWHTRTYIGYAVAGLGAAAALASLIMMSREPDPAEGPATGTRGKKSELAIAPLIAPGVAGAQIALVW